MQDWFTEYIACNSSTDSVIFGGGEELTIVGKGNVQIYFGGKMLIFINVYYVLGMELKLHSISQIMKHRSHLYVIFRNHKCYIVDKESKKTNALGVVDHGLFTI